MADALDDLADDAEQHDSDTLGRAPVDLEHSSTTFVEDIPFCAGVEFVIATNLHTYTMQELRAAHEGILDMLRLPAGCSSRLQIPGAK